VVVRRWVVVLEVDAGDPRVVGSGGGDGNATAAEHRTGGGLCHGDRGSDNVPSCKQQVPPPKARVGRVRPRRIVEPGRRLILEVDAEYLPHRRTDVVGRITRAEWVLDLERDRARAAGRACDGVVRTVPDGVVVVARAARARWAVEEVLGQSNEAEPGIVAQLPHTVVVVFEDDAQRR